MDPMEAEAEAAGSATVPAAALRATRRRRRAATRRAPAAPAAPAVAAVAATWPYPGYPVLLRRKHPLPSLRTGVTLR